VWEKAVGTFTERQAVNNTVETLKKDPSWKMEIESVNKAEVHLRSLQPPPVECKELNDKIVIYWVRLRSFSSSFETPEDTFQEHWKKYRAFCRELEELDKEIDILIPKKS
jgi:hypothetical protein